jgi:hypothetical protein
MRRGVEAWTIGQDTATRGQDAAGSLVAEYVQRKSITNDPS